MSTKNRIRRSLDFGRLREALAAPGIDGRTWVCLARVDEEQGAIYWLPGSGWIVDVTPTTGQLAGEGPIACRWASPYGGAGEGATCPVRPGAEVVVVWAGGDPTVGPVIVGVLWNPADQPPPATVNGQAVDQALASATHVAVTPSSVQQQVGPVWRTEATQQATLGAPQVRLADDGATHPFVLGDDMKAAIDNFAQALIAPGAYTSSSPVVASVTLTTAVTTLANALQAALSTRIKGE